MEAVSGVEGEAVRAVLGRQGGAAPGERLRGGRRLRGKERGLRRGFERGMRGLHSEVLGGAAGPEVEIVAKERAVGPGEAFVLKERAGGLQSGVHCARRAGEGRHAMAAAPGEGQAEHKGQAARARQRLGGCRPRPRRRWRQVVEQLVGADVAEPAGGGAQNAPEPTHEPSPAERGASSN